MGQRRFTGHRSAAEKNDIQIVASIRHRHTDGMRIHCLGTGGYHPSELRQTSCYFLAKNGILIDAGSGAFRLAPLIQTDSIDILLSHAHLDHIVGLTYLLDVFYQRPIKRLRIWGEQEKLQAVRSHLFSDPIFPVELIATWHPIDDLDSFRIGAPDAEAATVTWRRQTHPGGSVAYRLQWPHVNKSLVYATDTVGDESNEMSDWIQSVDLLMHECNFTDDAQAWAIKTGHCWTSRAAGIANAARVKHLLLTHVNPLADPIDPVDIKQAQTIFPNSTIATDMSAIDF